MAKKSMKIKYKKPKRQKNKEIIDMSADNQVKAFIYTSIGVLVFLGVIYLGVIAMEKLGLFEAGYTKPETGEVEFDYNFITMGTVLNRGEKTYYVLFDDYKNTITQDIYINDLLSKQDKYRVYKVDMNENENKKYVSQEANENAQSVNDIRINGITLIKVTSGKIVDYITGSDNIEEYLK